MMKRRATRRMSRSVQRERTERHLGMPMDEWRQRKRQEWAAVLNALDVFLCGSAYTPTGNDLFELQKAADRIKDALSQEWVCW